MFCSVNENWNVDSESVDVVELNQWYSTFGERSVDLAQLCALQPPQSGAPDSAAAAEQAQTDTAAAMADEKPKVRSGFFLKGFLYSVYRVRVR